MANTHAAAKRAVLEIERREKFHYEFDFIDRDDCEEIISAQYAGLVEDAETVKDDLQEYYEKYGDLSGDDVCQHLEAIRDELEKVREGR